MSRLSVLFSLSGFALSARPVDFPVALTIDQRGFFVSRAFVARTDGHSIPFKLIPGRSVTIGASVYDASSPFAIGFDMLSNPERMYTITVEHPFIFDPSASSYMGIAYDSPLTQQAGAVAVIIRDSTNAEMNIGATRDHFNASCRPGTLMTLDVSRHGELAGERYIDGVQVRLGNESLMVNFGSHRMRITGLTPRRANVPQALYERVRESLISSGFVEGERPYIFSGCTEAVLETLPTIRLDFSSGSLLYFPEDYVQLNSGDGTCSLLLGSVVSDRPIDIDPLRLIGQNVRVTRDNVWDICESNAE
jgi:hypothetical protein